MRDIGKAYSKLSLGLAKDLIKCTTVIYTTLVNGQTVSKCVASQIATNVWLPGR